MTDESALEDLIAQAVPIKSWACPDHPDGEIKWWGSLARCLHCNRNSRLEFPPCPCPTNECGDIRCHRCGEMVTVKCWKCDTKRGDGPCPNQAADGPEVQP